MSSLPSPAVELRCPRCKWRKTYGRAAMVDQLRALGRLKPKSDASDELLRELFRVTAQQMNCPECGESGLVFGEPEEDALDDEAWGMARPCDECGRPIPAERLEIFPNSRLCVACQQKSDRGTLPEAVEYCPRCGTPMTLRQSRGAGVTRYVMACPSCR